MCLEIAGGSVTGRDHVALGRNNQDAFCWSSTAEATVAVVADGCGSGRYSEVGAHLGARLLTEALRARATRFDEEPAEELLEGVRRDLLAQLRVLANGMGGTFRQVVSDYFLFTLLGFVITPRTTTVFGIGDGLFSVDAAALRLEAPGNAPAYAAYGLISSDVEAPRFALHARGETAGVRRLLIATDGAFDIPDLELAELGTADRYFANPYTVGRRLVQMNRAVRPGRPPDDTTVVVARRAG